MSLFMKHFNGDCSITYAKCIWEKRTKTKCKLDKVEFRLLPQYICKQKFLEAQKMSRCVTTIILYV